jgi:CheY-like chemotaxis protein
MGGSIALECPHEGGSRFSVSLPLAPHAAPLASALPDAPPSLGLHELLLVEDDPVNQLVMQASLTAMGLHVVVAGTAPAAWELLRSQHFACVLVDRHLPGMDGAELVRRWRAEEAQRGLARVPMIAVTGDVDDKSRAACLAAGVDAVLGKPVSRAALAAAMQALGVVHGGAAAPSTA